MTDKEDELSAEQQLAKVKRELESMVLRYAKSESENLTNKAKSEELDKKLKRAIKDNDSLANRIKILTNDKTQLTDTLNAKVAHITVLEQKNRSLNNLQSGRLHELETEIQQLRQSNDDLLKQINTYKSKEGELLDFSERLSIKQVLLQTELDQALQLVPNHLVEENTRLKDEVKNLLELQEACQENVQRERKIIEELRRERHKLELNFNQNLEELHNEIKVLKRKYQMATKELLKQMKVSSQNGNKVAS